jgi:hypothetical protein
LIENILSSKPSSGPARLRPPDRAHSATNLAICSWFPPELLDSGTEEDAASGAWADAEGSVALGSGADPRLDGSAFWEVIESERWEGCYARVLWVLKDFIQIDIVSCVIGGGCSLEPELGPASASSLPIEAGWTYEMFLVRAAERQYMSPS